MGLLNVSHSAMTQSVIDFQEELIKNPFYLFNDKKALPVDYYNLNKEKTTLDPALKISYGESEDVSSLRYNLIRDFYLYGLDRIAFSLDMGDFGVETSEISGEAIVLPDTITPYPGDQFVIKMTKQRYQFSVNSVSMDTYDNGANYWKIEYGLSHLTDDGLASQIVDEYNFISGNVGTEFSPVLQKTKYDLASKLDDAAVALKNVFKGLYFNNKVQTFTFVYMYFNHINEGMNSAFFYDPYLIEFIIKNKILANSGEAYEFVDHKTNLRPEFGIKYNRSIWKVLETREKNELSSCKHSSVGKYIDDPSTIFGTRYENYFELVYNDHDMLLEKYNPPIDIIDPQVIGHILEDQLFDQNSKYAKYNLLVKYFNYHKEIGIEDIIPLERIIETENNMENYFLLPMIIFVLEFYIKNMIARKPKL